MTSFVELVSPCPNFHFGRPARVLITGAAGRIGSTLASVIAQGLLLGGNQRIELVLLDIPEVENVLIGQKMELDDCCFPSLSSVTTTVNENVAFKEIDIAILIASAGILQPGGSRRDLIVDNQDIYACHGRLLNELSPRVEAVCVVANPVNTLVTICAANAPDISTEKFTGVVLADYLRALSRTCSLLDVSPCSLKGLLIFGNHSPSVVVALSNATFFKENRQQKVDTSIMEDVQSYTQNRGLEVLQIKKSSTLTTPLYAILLHVRSLFFGTAAQDNVHMATLCHQSVYGIPRGICCTVPVKITGRRLTVDASYRLDEQEIKALDGTFKDLLEERKLVNHLIPRDFETRFDRQNSMDLLVL
ncbi:hypothetical protein RCL1_002264 [Eukaryota sp. TZLM3-RCL]